MRDEKKSYMINDKCATHEEYLKTRYEDLRACVVKDRKIEIQMHIETHNETINAFINRAIAETMERDNAQK